MIIKILGSRGQVPLRRPHYSRHSGILIDGKILIDAGEKEFLESHPALILFSHFHPDHAFFAEGRRKISFEVPVYAPEHIRNAEGIKIIRKALEWKGYRITPVPTIHSFRLKSQGYVIEKRNRKLFYSGDLLWIEKKYQRLLRGTDLVITEASFFRKGGVVRRHRPTGKVYGHMGVPDLVKLFGKFTNQIIFTHFGNWFLADVISGKKKIKALENDKLKLDTAFDGKIIRM